MTLIMDTAYISYIHKRKACPSQRSKGDRNSGHNFIKNKQITVTYKCNLLPPSLMTGGPPHAQPPIANSTIEHSRPSGSKMHVYPEPEKTSPRWSKTCQVDSFLLHCRQ
uniref:Uncharacterized protein n=1 Tax=Opuntia streptacantha TaxID=393608 RepID=A0A7C8Z311_OPUST